MNGYTTSNVEDEKEFLRELENLHSKYFVEEKKFDRQEWALLCNFQIILPKPVIGFLPPDLDYPDLFPY